MATADSRQRRDPETRGRLAMAAPVVGVAASGIASGTLVTNAVGVLPAMRVLSEADAMRFHHALEPRIDRYNPPSVMLAILSGIAGAVQGRRSRVRARVGNALGLAGALIIAATSLGVNMRINRQIRELDPVVDRAEYADLRHRWEVAHRIRTAGSLVAVAGYGIAAADGIREGVLRE